MTEPELRPLACTRCGGQCGVVEDYTLRSDLGPAVINEDGVIQPQSPDTDEEFNSKLDPRLIRSRAYCLNRTCGHWWTLRRRVDPTPAA
ncbi:hypothetical protein [Streptomyces griseus]|uniref:hypothetical protein n=1 Tax=Streptomyces griseus TaxID=1911 RepID=UPI0033C25FC8